MLERLARDLGADLTAGLSTESADEHRARTGPNRLPEPVRPTLARRLLAQLASPLVLTLLGAAAIAVIVGLSEPSTAPWPMRFADALAILLIVALNAVLGLVQESKAEKALDALSLMSAPTARVRRDGVTVIIPADRLVPGDVIELEAGDAIPADARLIEAVELSADESALTGESTPSAKDARAIIEHDAAVADRANMVFLGATIVRGKARALVVSTGATTELGRIGAMLAGAGLERTPLEQRLDVFGRRVLWACVAASVALFALGVFGRARPWHVVLLEAVSLAVAAIPEGLPAITTIVLGLGTQRMAKHGAIVRRLPAVETLGAATVICTDKTGTLTQNEMTVRAVWAAGASMRVTGQGYAPEGVVLGETEADDEAMRANRSVMDSLAMSAVLCNDAKLALGDGAWKAIGDPTEAALLVLAAKLGQSPERAATRARIVREIPFSSERGLMTVVAEHADGERIAHVKGSLESVLARSTKIADRVVEHSLTDEDRRCIEREAEGMAARALRVLAIAHKSGRFDDPESELTLLGLVGMMDPPRAGVFDAITVCRSAGIRPVMITGDHPKTALAIARELGLWSEGDEVMTGPELAALDGAALSARVQSVRVFARTSAEQKLRIVRALKDRGEVVAMTGDGVNDAPALREAHIGVAMGRGGTDVARQSADLVITDDNFATIVEAIREGRAIYRNIQKVIFYLLSSNAALTLTVFAVALAGWSPLTPLMILCINFVTNGPPAVALGIDPPASEQMLEPPRRASAGLLGGRDALGIAFVGAMMACAAVALYVWPRLADSGSWSRAAAFAVLGVSPLFHAWNSRSPSGSIFAQRPVAPAALLAACGLSAAVHALGLIVPALRPIFHTYPLDLLDWALIGLLSFSVIPFVEVAKWLEHKVRALVVSRSRSGG